MGALPSTRHADVLVGYDTSDDAGVFRLTPEQALVQTVDLITPVVDDPREFGRIAAANSLSDVYAMGGRPLTALNILCFPAGEVPVEVAREILRGGAEKIEEAGAVLLGGHSVRDRELKYGLSVTGLVHPGNVLANSGARAGDAVVLTKALGTGVLATALKGGVARGGEERALVASAGALNRAAAEAMEGLPVHACTDVTGFGLVGHLVEVARASGVVIELRAGSVPLLEGAAEHAAGGILPEGCHANRDYYRAHVAVAGGVAEWRLDLLHDPQTSGGLLIFVAGGGLVALLAALDARGQKAAAVIGEVRAADRCGGVKILP